jgi:hypothetical protein
VCGLDAETRSRIVGELTRRLGQRDRTVALADPILQADATGTREGGIPPTRSRLWPALLASIFRTSGLFKGYKFAEMVERARLDEAFEDGRLARFVVGDGSPLVDVLAWAQADFYRGKFEERHTRRLLRYLSGERRIPFRRWGRFVLDAPELWLLNVFDLARPRAPDLLVLLKLPSSTVLARKRMRGEPIEAYERPELLDRIDRAYDAVGDVLERRGRTARLRVDVEESDPTALAERILREIPELEVVEVGPGESP